jgi:uncharacterized protein (TIGR02001 family)
MTGSRILLKLCGALGAALVASSAGALADGYEVAAPAPVDEGRKFNWSFNIGATSDYVFRGISQTDNDPTIQGGLDFSYGILYAGAWASGLDFAGSVPPVPGDGLDAQVEIDWYGGIRPTWNSPLGTVNLDFGVIYYSYPGATDFFANVDYVEFKAGYSWSVLHPQLTTGTTVYYSPDYTFETGPVWTVETMAAWAFKPWGVFAPVVNGVLGWQKGDSSEGYFVNAIKTDDEFYYWNAGLALTVEKLTFDFRYWDTNIGGDAAGPFCGREALCDGRFVFSAKVVLP